MEIKDMDFKAIETRKAEITAMLDDKDLDIDKLEELDKEVDALEQVHWKNFGKKGVYFTTKTHNLQRRLARLPRGSHMIAHSRLNPPLSFLQQ